MVGFRNPSCMNCASTGMLEVLLAPLSASVGSHRSLQNFDLPLSAAHVKFDEVTPLIPLESTHILLMSQLTLMPHIVTLTLFPPLDGVYMKAKVLDMLAFGMPSSNAIIVSLDLTKTVSFHICRT